MASLSTNVPTDVLLSGHVETNVSFSNREGVSQQCAQLISFMDNQNVDTSNYKFIDVPPTARRLERVRDGQKNEEIAKRILAEYGIGVEEVEKESDMYDKVDFIAHGPFGKLHVQFKHRNISKNSTLNDLGVEYSRIKSGRRGLYVSVGRDRSTKTGVHPDVYLSVDSAKRHFHWLPTHMIEEAAKEVHRPYIIQVAQRLEILSNGLGDKMTRPSFEISKLDIETRAVVSTSKRSAVMEKDGIGQIRYFKPKGRNEGIFKSVFYVSEAFVGSDWTHVLKGETAVPQQ